MQRSPKIEKLKKHKNYETIENDENENLIQEDKMENKLSMKPAGTAVRFASRIQRRDLNGTDIELGDVDSEPNIPVQPITIRKLNSRFSTTETTGKLGNPRQESSLNPVDVSNWKDYKSWPEVIKERNGRRYTMGKSIRAKPSRKLNYPEFVMHAYGEDANACLKDEREEFMGSITKVLKEADGWIIHSGVGDIAKVIATHKTDLEGPIHKVIATVDTAPWSEEMEELETENETVDFLNEKLVRHSFHEIVYFDSNAESDFIYKHFPEDDQDDQDDIMIPWLGILLRGTLEDINLINRDHDLDQPTILFRAGGGLAEYISDFLQDSIEPIKKRIDIYAKPNKLEEYGGLGYKNLLEVDYEDLEENLAKFYERRNTFLFIWDTDGQDKLEDILVRTLYDNDQHTEPKISQLALLKIALYLDRTEDAENLLDSSKLKTINTNNWKRQMLYALNNKKINYIETMVNHGFDFNDFLTWETLLAIYIDNEYNYKKINTKFQEFLNRTYAPKPDSYAERTTAPFNPRSHFEDIMIMLSDFERAVTFSDVVTHREDCDKSAGKDCKYIPNNGEMNIVEKCVQNSYNGIIPNEVCHQSVIKPLKELLIWSVLIDEPDLTDIFLGLRKQYGLQDRLVLTAMFKSMRRQWKYTNQIRYQRYDEQKDKRMEEVTAILTNATYEDEDKLSIMIRRETNEWSDCDKKNVSGLSCLEMANRSAAKDFFDHQSSRKLVLNLFAGQIDEDLSGRGRVGWLRFLPLSTLFFWPLASKNVHFTPCQRNHPNDNVPDAVDNWTFWQKIRAFFRSPKTVYCMNVWGYIVLLVFYSLFLMYGYCENASLMEWYLFAWVLAMFVDELRQIATAPIRKGIKSPIKKIGHKLRTWYGDDPWNKIDLAFELFFFSAFILKNIVWYYSTNSDHFDEAHREIKNDVAGGGIAELFQCEYGVILHESMSLNNWFMSLAHGLYAMAFGFLCMRAAHFFLIHPVLGPQLQMITAMVSDLTVFLLLMAVFLICHGVILRSFENPNREWPFSSPATAAHAIYDIVFIPYFQIYGELFVEDFGNDGKIIVNTKSGFLENECNKTDTECCFNGAIKEFQEIQKTFDDIEKCYTRPKLSVLATMYYMMLANVIMLNILIAMFNHSYERVKERSMKINAFQRYQLAMEYIDKFVMPPPLNIISFVFWITAVSYRKLRRYLHDKAGEKEPTWKKKHRYTNIFGLYPPKIHLLTAEEKKHSEMSKSRDSSTENTLPSLFQYVDAIKPFFARDLSTGINGSFGYTVEDIDDFEEMVTKNALEQVETTEKEPILESLEKLKCDFSKISKKMDEIHHALNSRSRMSSQISTSE